MDERLLSYYNRELAYIRKMGAEFGDKHPKIAGRLRLDQDSVEDPHVSRLIESFAFLTARIRHTLDDSFPELTESLIGLMYPAYHAPLPSMSIIKCHAIPKVAQYQKLEKDTELLVHAGEYGTCRFRTCDDIHVLPVDVTEAKFSPVSITQTLDMPGEPLKTQARAELKLAIRPIPNAKLADLEQDTLRFFISAQSQVAYRLMDFLANNLCGGCVANKQSGQIALSFASDSIHFPSFDMQGVGNENHDGRNHSGYQSITDYFVFPQKFLFFEVSGFSSAWENNEQGFDLYLFFDESHPELIQAIDNQSFQLGCAPVINLYEDKTDPIDASKCYGEEQLYVQTYRHDFADIHTVKKVRAFNAKGETELVPPFYGKHQQPDDSKTLVYWHTRRENSAAFNGYSSFGTDTYISLVDKNFDVVCADERWLIEAEVTCTNRDIPSRLPFGPDQPKFDFIEGGAGLRLKCLTPPTNTYQPQLDKSSRWQFITQLGLQSFAGQQGIEQLKMALQLYDLRDSRETRSAIAAIQSIDIKQVTERVVINSRAAMCVGSECTLVIDDSAFAGNSIYLFGKVIHQFLVGLCAMNSFVSTRVCHLSDIDNYHDWPATLGTQALL